MKDCTTKRGIPMLDREVSFDEKRATATRKTNAWNTL